jgi:hypothetical protein
MLATRTQAQVVDATINPISILFADINMGVDFKVNDNFSIGASAGYGRGDLWGLVDSRETVPVMLIGKYYVSPKHGADRFYVDGFGRYVTRRIQASYEGENQNIPDKVDFRRTQVGLGFGIGYKAVSEKGFVFDIGTGIGRALYSHDSVNVSEEDYKIPELFRTIAFFRIGVGYRFGMNRE